MKELITKSFQRQALAFPSRVDQMLSTIETVEQAKDMLDKASAMQHYADRLRAGVEVERPIALGVLKIKAKLGELMPATPKSQTGRGNKVDGVPVDFNKSTLATYRKLAANKDKLEKYYEDCEDVPTQSEFLRYVQPTHVSQNSAENEWYTPAQYILLARGVMGSIDLDPASSEQAQETVDANLYYSIEDDGLSKKWFGNVWLNPPYAKNAIGKFASKLCEHYSSGDISQAIMLVNNATDTVWFQYISKYMSAICFVAGRIKFFDASGRQVNSPLQGQSFIYFGSNRQRFCEAFAGTGFCLQQPVTHAMEASA